jgi:uncharacterized membrane protein YdjX (TVP38/TMEM64 family)
MMESTARSERSTSAGIKVLVGLLLVAAIAATGRWAGAYLPQIREWVEGLGAWGPAAFIAVYAIAAVAFVPASALTLGAGAIFGVAKGTLLVFVAATLGASAAFTLARYVARAAVERRIEADPRFAAIDRAVASEGRKIVVLLRLSPVFPFNLLNDALGLTRVRFIDYFVASVGMLPGTLMYVYIGSLGGQVAAAAGGVESARSASEWALLAVGLAATIAVTVAITRIARRALAEATR